MPMTDAQRNTIAICEHNLGCKYTGPDTLQGAKQFLRAAVPLSKALTEARKNGPVTEKQENFIKNYEIYTGEKYTGPMTFSAVHAFTKQNWDKAINAVAAQKRGTGGQFHSMHKEMFILDAMKSCDWEDTMWPDSNQFHIGDTPDVDTLRMDLAIWSLLL